MRGRLHIIKLTSMGSKRVSTRCVSMGLKLKKKAGYKVCCTKYLAAQNYWFLIIPNVHYAERPHVKRSYAKCTTSDGQPLRRYKLSKSYKTMWKNCILDVMISYKYGISPYIPSVVKAFWDNSHNFQTSVIFDKRIQRTNLKRETCYIYYNYN